MNRIYQCVKALPLILILVCSTSFADAGLESYRIDSNNSVTQKLNNGGLVIDFIADQAISLKNVTLDINNIILDRNDYRVNCDILENSTECTITINPVRSLLLNGKFILRTLDGDTIVTGNSNHELAFTLDKLKSNKLKISNLLTDQPLIINTINGKPMLTDSTLAPLGYTIIDLSDNGTATLECSINGENLTYTVKTTKQINDPGLDITNIINGKTIAIVAAGGGGALLLAGGMGASLYKLLHKRAMAIKYHGVQKKIDDRVIIIKEDLNKATKQIGTATDIAFLKCSGNERNEVIGMQVVELTAESALAIAGAKQTLQTYTDSLFVSEVKFIQSLDLLDMARLKTTEALKKANEAVDLAKNCSDDGLKEKRLQLRIKQREQDLIGKEAQILSATINTIRRDLDNIQKKQDKLNPTSQEWQTLESSKQPLRSKLEAAERDQRQSIANYDEQQSSITQTEQELSEINTRKEQQQELAIKRLQRESEIAQKLDQPRVSEISNDESQSSSLALSGLRKQQELEKSDSGEEITKKPNYSIIYNGELFDQKLLHANEKSQSDNNDALIHQQPITQQRVMIPQSFNPSSNALW